MVEFCDQTLPRLNQKKSKPLTKKINEQFAVYSSSNSEMPKKQKIRPKSNVCPLQDIPHNLSKNIF